MTEYRFAKVLADFAAKESYAELERVIRQSNGTRDDEPPPVDRRKLQRLAAGDATVVMSLREFNALDRWLEPQGEGLAFKSLLDRPNVLQAIAHASCDVIFLPGSKPQGPRMSLDRWDVKALAKVQRGVNRLGPQVQFDIRDVYLHEDLDDARYSITKGSWIDRIRKKRNSIVVPGSGKATHAADYLLPEMFGARRMTDDQDKTRLPFHFVWPADDDHAFPGPLRYTLDELAAVSPKAAKTVRQHAGPALVVDGEVLLDTLRDNLPVRETYGVAVAQRRPGGQIWLVLAGISGVATYAAARVLDKVPLDLSGPEDEASPVFWTVVHAKAKRDTSRRVQENLTLTFAKASPPQAWDAA